MSIWRGILVLLLVLSSPCHAAVISVVPHAAEVAPGESFAVDISIADVSDLYGFQFSLDFSPGTLGVLHADEGAFFSTGGGFFEGIIDNASGKLDFVANTILGPGPGLSGGGVLATITFNALAAGNGEISVSDLLLLNSDLEDISVDSLDAAEVVVRGAPVDEPHILLLMSLGVLSMRFMKRKTAGDRRQASGIGTGTEGKGRK